MTPLLPPAASKPSTRGRFLTPTGYLLVAVWAGMTASLVWYVVRFGDNVPMWEEWCDVPAVVGGEGRAGWVFARLNEHRYIVGRALWLAGFELSGHDYRAGMFLNVAFLSAASAVLLRAAARVRGRSHPTDVLIPGFFLNPAGWENLILGYQVAFTLDVFLAALLIRVAADATADPPGRTAVRAGLLLGLLALGGWVGLAFVPAGVVWTLFLVWRYWQSGGGFAACMPLLIPPTAAAAWFVWCYADVMARPVDDRTPNTVATAAQVGIEFLAGSLGPAGWKNPIVCGAVTIGLLATLVGSLGWVTVRRPTDRPTAIGWLVVVSAVVLMAYGTAKWRPNGHAVRNLPLTALLPAVGLLAAVRFGPSRPAINWAATAAVVGLVGYDNYHGWRGGLRACGQFHLFHKQLDADREAGFPLPYLAYRHFPFPNSGVPNAALVLRDRGHPSFAGVPDGPPVLAEPLTVPVPTTDPVPRDPLADSLIGSPRVWRFDLGRERSVTGVRVRFRYSRTSLRVGLHVLTRGTGPDGTVVSDSGCYPWLCPSEWTFDFWVDRPADTVWVRAMNAADDIDVISVELLVPPRPAR